MDRPVLGSLSLEKCIYIAVWILAIATRFYIAGIRPLHHDESIHAVFSWKITTDGPVSYQYDPVYHGPVMYFWTALCFALFGDSDWVSRLSPNLFGFGLMAFAWPLRRQLGRWGALWFLILMTISPSWTYFTRFLRHDIYVALFNVAAVYFGARFFESRAPKYLYGTFAALALSYATKEDMYALGPIMIIGLISALAWEVVYARDRGAAWRAVWTETKTTLRESLLPLITGIVIFIVIWLLFYTSFGYHPEKWNGVTPALKYWLGQHEIQRIGGPWWYYFPHLFGYEQLIFGAALAFLLTPLFNPRDREPSSTRNLVYATGIVAMIAGIGTLAFPARAPYLWIAATTLAGFVHMLRWLPDRFTRFCIVYTIGSFVFYAWAQEKVPWLLVPILTPMTLVAARWFNARAEEGWFQRPAAALGLTALCAYSLFALVLSNYLYDAPRPSENPERRHAEILAYVQSTYDIHEKVMDRIETTAQALGTGTKTRLAISGDATWPMSWYVRHYPVNWGAGVRKIDVPIIIMDLDAARSIEETMSATYDKVRFQIRGWWEPNWSMMTPARVIRYLFTREAWSPVGSSDAVMFALKDPKPGMAIETIDVNPPPPPRGYPSAPELLEPAAVWGRQGSGPLEFNEPRSLVVDSAGNIYVCDSKNNRIQKIGPDGKMIAAWGSEGAEPGQFKDPYGIALGPDGTVYVADTWNHRVQKLDSHGNFLKQWPGGFWGPRGIAVSPDGKHVYVTDTGNKRVVHFDNEGTQLGTWGSDGSKPGQLIEPVGIAVNAEGQVYVADTGNRRIQVFTQDGEFVAEHSISGWEEFYTEPYIALRGNDLLVSDSYNHRVALYRNWTVAYSWGRSGSAAGSFNRPIGIAADSQGAVYVADTMNHRIQKFVLPNP
ncbi:MAG TPA: flippase activity-associated protein Agl23 [Terriglobales bacterium]|nr:flippase activity-associated protein Agl23 [Terriglobales bacterium]